MADDIQETLVPSVTWATGLYYWVTRIRKAPLPSEATEGTQGCWYLREK